VSRCSIAIHESSDFFKAAGDQTHVGRYASESSFVLNMDQRRILLFEILKRRCNQVTVLTRIAMPKEFHRKMLFADSAIFEEFVENEPLGMTQASEFESHWNFFHLYWIFSVPLI
jgi:hypothetical protein